MRNQMPIFFLGAFVGTIITYAVLASNSLFSSVENEKTIHKDVFVLSIKITFTTLDGREKFKLLFGEFAQWIKKNEPGTLSYEMSQSDSNPLELLILERYVTKLAYTEQHRTSLEFLEFKKKIVDLNSETNRERFGWSLQGQSYYETNVGFM